MIVGTGLLDQPAGHRFERPPGFPHWTIGAVLAGDSRIDSAAGFQVQAAPGLILIRPRTAYRVRAGHPGRGWREAWVLFTPRPDWPALFEWPEPLPGVMAIAGDGRDFRSAVAALVEVHRIVAGAGPERARFAENQLERALLLAHLVNPQARHARRHPVVRAALQVIAAQSAERLDVATLARRAGCSPSHLAHRFAADLGTTPMAYLEAQRIERAKHLLISSMMAVKAVAAAVGYDNPFHFSTRFRKQTGLSPQAWRRGGGER
jgi:AraC family transcriptional regulator of arabinose operon